VKRDQKLFLNDIVSAMESIESFVEGMTLEEVEKDDKTSRAVVRKFEIIGEATKHLSEKIKEENPEIPWKNMAGMRNRLIHAYFGVDYKLVWEAIKIEIPRLKPKLEEILEKLD